MSITNSNRREMVVANASAAISTIMPSSASAAPPLETIARIDVIAPDACASKTFRASLSAALAMAFEAKSKS
jgi:hypothetical protein